MYECYLKSVVRRKQEVNQHWMGYISKYVNIKSLRDCIDCTGFDESCVHYHTLNLEKKVESKYKEHDEDIKKK